MTTLVSIHKIWQKKKKVFCTNNIATTITKIITIFWTCCVAEAVGRQTLAYMVVQNDTVSTGITYQLVSKVHWHFPFHLAIPPPHIYLADRPAYTQKKVSTKFALQRYWSLQEWKQPKLPFMENGVATHETVCVIKTEGGSSLSPGTAWSPGYTVQRKKQDAEKICIGCHLLYKRAKYLYLLKEIQEVFTRN